MPSEADFCNIWNLGEPQLHYARLYPWSPRSRLHKVESTPVINSNFNVLYDDVGLQYAT